MGRGSSRRTWIKLHCWGRLHGSIVYQLEEAEQSVWDKLLCFAGEVNRGGQISDNDGRPFPHPFVAHEIHTRVELLESTLEKCKKEGRIIEDEHGICITNWAAYQSEYERQKPYREKTTEKAAAERGAKTAFTYEMLCTVEDEMERSLEEEDKGREKTMIYTASYFWNKYGKEKGGDYGLRYMGITHFIEENTEALRSEGLIWQDEETSQDVVSVDLYKVMLDSFTKEGGTRARPSYPVTSLGDEFGFDLHKVLEAVKTLLEEAKDEEETASRLKAEH